MTRKKSELETLTDSLPLKSVTNCNICQSPHRPMVDRFGAAGFSNVAIAEELMILDPDFKDKQLEAVRKNVERHLRNHVDIRSKAIRRVVEQRAKEQGILIDQAEGQFTTGRALLDTIIAVAQSQLANPDSRVRYADALEAVKQLEDVQRSEYMAQLEVLQRQVYAISEAVKKIVPSDLHPLIVAEAKRVFDGAPLELKK